MMLIIAGGIGFLTWEDIKNHKWHFKKYRMQSKVIFMVTGISVSYTHLDVYKRQVIRCPVVKNRESELQEHFSMNAL